MKRFYLKLMILIAAVTGSGLSALAQTVTFGYTGAVQYYTVGPGVTSVGVDMQGAKGGDGNCSSSGGGGGRVQCVLSVTPGQVLNIYVGQKGPNYTSTCCGTFHAGGYNGGGSTYDYGGSGGGASDIRVGGIALSNRVIVAGGGGGGSCNCSSQTGGAGGGTTGGTGLVCGSSSGGTGGTQSAGGNRGTWSGGGTGGSLGQGGNFAYYSTYYAGGGGGGGYYGGGTGSQYSSGGGGSSFPATNGGNITSLTHTPGYNTTGDGSVTIIGPTLNVSPTALAFGSVVVGSVSPTATFSMSGSNLCAGPFTVTPPSGFEISTSSFGPFVTTPLSITYTPPTLNPTTIYVRFVPGGYSAYSANLTISGGCTPGDNVALSGTGVFPCSGTTTGGTSAISPSTGGGTTVFNLTNTGSSSGGGITYQWQSSAYPTAFFSDISGATTAAYNFTGISSTTYYRLAVTCPSSGTSYSTVVSATIAPSTIIMPRTGSSTTTTCNADFYDSGGPSGQYTDNENATYTFFPGSPGAKLRLAFSSFTIETCCDRMYIYNGNSTAAPLVGTYTSLPPTFTSTASDGSLTVRFTTDGSVYYAGWAATIDCFYPPCSGTPTPGTLIADASVGCNPFPVNILYTDPVTMTGLTYQWQSSPDSATWTDIAGATQRIYSTTVAATRWYRMKVKCGTPQAFSDGIKMTLHPTPAVFSGPTNLCVGVPVSLSTTPTGGTWISNNNIVASVGITSGLVSPASPGSANITYTSPAGCTRSAAVSVNLTPQPISGPSQVCLGSAVTLNTVTTGGSWVSSNPSLATVGSISGVVTGLAVGSTTISYVMPSGCYSLYPMTINPPPAAITGGVNVCIGGTLQLSDATPGGNWITSNSFQAAVVPTTGVVSGVSLGSPVISYMLPTGCVATQVVTVNPLPGPISGSAGVCVGASATLTNASAGTWSSSAPGIATINSTSGSAFGWSSGGTVITFTHGTTGCIITRPLSVYLTPSANNVTGGGGYCTGGTGVHIGLDGSLNGVNYQLYQGSTPVGAALAGSTSGLDFGLLTATGIYTVQATDATTGCSSGMNGSAVISINPPPTAYTLTGGGVYCIGGVGVHVGLSSSDLGIKYQLYVDGNPAGAPVNGVGGPLDFGLQTTSGTYSAVATNAATLCINNMAGVAYVSTSALPTAYSVTGGGPYCSGDAGVHVILSNSAGGVEYQLYRNGVAVDAPLPGTGAALDMDALGNPMTIPGVYTVVAADVANGCSNNMSGSATIFVNPLPTVYSVTGGGNFCAGGTGVHVGLNFSITGTDYQLYRDGSPVGAAVHGSNAGLDFGLLTTPGAYTVVATNIATGCPNTMAGAATVAVNPLPTLYSVTGGGPYCVGVAGAPVGTDGSDVGVNYQLYRGMTMVGAPVPGNGLALDFGPQATPGIYSVRAVNASTGCASDMTGSVVVTISNLPNVYTLSFAGPGHYCSGGSGVELVLSNSQPGVDYQLYVGGVPAGLSVTGLGGPISFGMQAAPGSYIAVATGSGTGCSINMSGTPNVAIDPLPASYNVTGGGDYCAGGTGLHTGLSLSNTGISYQLQLSGSDIGSPIMGTGASIDFGTQTGAGAYTIVATNVVTGCAANMNGAATINIKPLPAIYVVSGGGSYCSGDTGVHVLLSGTSTGISYQLYNGASPMGTAITGTGSALDFGLQTAAGAYTVIATDMLAGCNSSMASTASVTIKPLPTAYAVSGGGNYCAGGTGVHVLLSGSNLGGVMYQLYIDDTVVEGTPWAGTGLPLDLGAHTSPGSYSVVATNPITGCSNVMSATAMVVVDSLVAASVDMVTSSMSDTLCAITPATFTAIPVNGGTSPVYNWKVNGIPVGGSGSTYMYMPSDNDVISVTLHSTAHCASPATSVTTHTLTATPGALPVASITATSGGVICPGSGITFNSTTTYPGSAPILEWRRNGVAIGSSGSLSYTPADGDVIMLVLKSNYECRLANTVYSNNITVVIDSPAMPVVEITTENGTTFALGNSVTFTAVAPNAGVGATYQWKINGEDVAGATAPVFTTSQLVSGNSVVGCEVSSHNSCGSRTGYNTLPVRVFSNVGVANVSGANDVALLPNPNKGAFTIKGTLANTATHEVSVEVTNMLGQVVYSSKITAQNGRINEAIQLNNSLANGMYILNLRSENENTVFHFVVEQ